MKLKYNLEWLINQFENGRTLEYLYFWGHTKKPKYGIDNSCFSQWFDLPFTVDGLGYQTAEHWMMARKALLFNDQLTHEKILKANKPAEAKELGRRVLGFDEQTWLENRYEIVMLGNIHKFNQHPEFAQYLISTSEHILVEASPIDIVWGIGLAADGQGIENLYEWRGLNLLGFALMEVRDFLKDFGYFDNTIHNITLPWKAYPNIDPFDMHWRMGKGEDLIIKFSEYLSTLSDRERVIFKLNNPEPYDWKRFYREY